MKLTIESISVPPERNTLPTRPALHGELRLNNGNIYTHWQYIDEITNKEAINKILDSLLTKLED